MNTQEQAEREAFKLILKGCVMNNNNLNQFQKQQAIKGIDSITKEADVLVEILRMCGFIQ